MFLVFEGGGAKGIVHVGALRALEERKDDLKIAGVAGTSAGAIVAALVAAGYSSEELIDANGGSPVLGAIGLQRATEMFGPAWGRLALLRWAANNKMLAAIILLLPGVVVGASGFWWLFWHWAIAALIGIVVSAVLMAVLVSLLAKGVVGLDRLADRLKLALSRKLGFPDGTCVRFCDMEDRGLPLRLVATDLAARKLTLFSSAATPGVRVAEAVAASAALPIACRPWMIDKRRYVDGGIVSNLPAWTFDEARAIDPDALTICVSIDAGAPAGDPEKSGPLGFLFSIFVAAMFGRRQLETRAAPRLFTLNLKTKVQVVDFDMTAAEVRKHVEDAKAAAIVIIRDRLFTLQDVFKTACAEICAKLDRRVPAGAAPRWRTRALISLRDEGATSSWRVQFGNGFLDTDSDDQLLLPDSSSMVGWAAREGLPVFDVPPFTSLPGIALDRRQDRYRRALVRRDLAWCMAIPIYAKGAPEDAPPVAILSADSDLEASYFGFNSDLVLQLEKDAQDLFQPTLDLLKDIEERSR